MSPSFLRRAITHTQAKFTADQHPQYIYSPRELSRWVRALYEAMNPLDALTLDELVRLWANEALRLFHDRLVTQEEQDWCQGKVRVGRPHGWLFRTTGVVVVRGSMGACALNPAH